MHDLYVVLQERAEHWAHKLKDRARFEQADSESLRETIHAAQDAVKEVQAEIDAKNDAAGDLRVEKGQLEVQVNQAVRRIVEELGVPIETALAAEALDNRTVAEDRAHRLRKQISNLGPVNPIAMEEFESLRSRREFMGAQIDDLDSSRRVAAEGRRSHRPQDARPLPRDVRAGRPSLPGDLLGAVPGRHARSCS